MITERLENYIGKMLVIAPLVILFTVTVFPFLFILVISFFNVRSYNFSTVWEFVGLEQYIKIFSDVENIKAIINTVTYILYSLAIEILLGVLIALLIFKISKKIQKFYLTGFLLPLLLAPIVVGMIWKQMFWYSGGLLNKILNFFGINPVVWLSHNPIIGEPGSFFQSLNFTTGFVSLIFIEVWQWTPLFIFGFLVSFSLVKKEIVNLAMIDGASQWRIIRDIYIPMAKPLMLGIILLRIMDMLKVYEIIWVLFGNSMNFANINIQLVELSINIRNYSYGAAFSVLVFIFVFLILLLGSRLVNYAGRLYYE
jgi:multiple sugar transport system permease protein